MEVFGQLHSPAELSTRTYIGTQWIRGWVGPKDRLDSLENKSPASTGNRGYISSDVQPEAWSL